MQGRLHLDSFKSTGNGPIHSPASGPINTKHKKQTNRQNTQNHNKTKTKKHGEVGSLPALRKEMHDKPCPKVYRLFADNFEEISHVLRVAWRAIRWEQYLQQNHRGEVLASLHWFDVQESFLKTRNILSSFEPHVRPHVMAVIVAHVVSPAYWGKEQGGVPTFCSFCNQSHVPDFIHIGRAWVLTRSSIVS